MSSSANFGRNGKLGAGFAQLGRLWREWKTENQLCPVVQTLGELENPELVSSGSTNFGRDEKSGYQFLQLSKLWREWKIQSWFRPVVQTLGRMENWTLVLGKMQTLKLLPANPLFTRVYGRSFRSFGELGGCFVQ